MYRCPYHLRTLRYQLRFVGDTGAAETADGGVDGAAETADGGVDGAGAGGVSALSGKPYPQAASRRETAVKKAGNIDFVVINRTIPPSFQAYPAVRRPRHIR
jgi:hypothetical protein